MGILEWFGAKPTMDDFARRLLARLEREQPGQWQWQRTDALLVHREGSQTSLGNIYLEYSQAARSMRGALLEKFLSTALSVGRTPHKLWALAAKDVYVVLRSRYDLDIAGLMMEGASAGPPAVVRRPWLADLELRLVYDFGQSVGTVQVDFIQTWGQSMDALFERGLQNLAALQAPVWEAMEEGLYSLSSEVSYTESFALVPKVVERLPFSTHAVLAPCNRGVLLAADGRSDAAVGRLLDLAVLALQEQPWPLTHTILERDGASWKPLQRGGATGRKLRDFVRMSEHAVYGDQKTALDRLHERSGVDVFVATASLMRRAEHLGYESWCTWTQTVDSLLPETDLVALLRDPEGPRESMLLVPWAAVSRACAPWMEATECSPLRWRVRGFPDDAAWSELERAAVPDEQ